MALLRAFADQASLALQNARLINETREALAYQTASSEVLAVIGKSMADAQPVFERIVDSIERLLPHKQIGIFLTPGDGLLYAAALRGLKMDLVQAIYPLPVEQSAAPAVLGGRRQIYYPDIVNGVDIPGSLRRVAEIAGNSANVVTPMLWQGRAIGTIAVTREPHVPFTERELSLLQTFADQAVIAIENARLFNETREALERQTATADILRIINQSPSDVTPVFDAIAERARVLCGALLGSTARFDGELLHLVGYHGVSPQAEAAMRSSFPRKPDLGSINGRCLLAKGPVQIADVEIDPHYQLTAEAKAAGYRSSLAVPMLQAGDVIGVIAVTRKEPGEFPQKLIELLQTFADQAVIAVENARLFNEVRAKTRDLEESLQQQTATADVLKVISRSVFDVQTVLDTLVESAYQLCNANLGLLYLKGDEAFECKAIAGPGVEEASAYFKGRPIRAGRATSAERVILTGQVQSVTDFFADPEFDPNAKEIIRNAGSSGLGLLRSTLAVPMTRNDAVIGVLVIASPLTGPFPQRQVDLLQTFADQAVIAIENARLFDEVQAKTHDLEESLQQQTATADVLKVISRSAFDLEPALVAICETAGRLCEADQAAIFTREGDRYGFAASFGFPPEYGADWRAAGPLAVDPIAPLPGARSIVERRPVQVLDVAADPAFHQTASRHSQARTALGIPLLRDGEPVGNFVLGRRRVEAFSDRQIELVQTFADQAVIAIENARLFDEVQARTRDLQEALKYQTGSANILNVIASSPTDVAPVLKAIVESASEVCEAYDAAVVLRDGDDLRFCAHHGPIPIGLEKWPINRRWTAGRAFVDQQPVHVEDLSDEKHADFSDGRELALQMGHRTILSVPLLRDKESIGAIVLRRTEVHPFSDKQIALLQTFADQAVIAIGNVRLFDEVQAKTRDIEEALKYQTGSANILNVIASSPTDVAPVLQAIVDSACELCDAYDALVRLKKGDGLAFGAHHGPLPVNLESVPFTVDSTAGVAMIERRPVHVHDLHSREGDRFPQSQAMARAHGERTILSVPLLREGEGIGAIVLRRREVHPFSDKQIALLQTFADQAVIAIGNVRLFEQVQQRTRELSRSLEDLRTAQDRLVQTEKLASLGQLTAGIAHEIKNPLNFVNNFSALSVELTAELNDLLKGAKISEDIRKEIDELTGLLKDNLGKVVQHGKRADSIVKNMLLHSREGSGEHRASDVNALVDESLNLAYHGARAEKPQFNVTLKRNFDPEAGMIEAFPQEITRVLLNLISNGFYAVTKRKAENGSAPYEPLVSATTKGRSDHVEICIRDNGTGIPPHVREKMFNPFFTTKPAGEGTGLGLSMSHDIIVKQHGGTIDVDTIEGQFTEFTILLPRTSNHSNKTRGLT
jgi:GAF domain-containing protein